MTIDQSRYRITLARIRDESPCQGGWEILLRSLGYADGRYDPDRTVTIGDIAQSNGASDAIWALRLIDDPRVRVAAIMPAVKRAATHTTDDRVAECIAAIERWLGGDDAVDLKAAAAWAAEAARAAAAAWEAAWAAANAAEAAYASEEAADAAAFAAAWAAEAAADAAYAAEERSRQARDLIEMFGLTRGGGQ